MGQEQSTQKADGKKPPAAKSSPPPPQNPASLPLPPPPNPASVPVPPPTQANDNDEENNVNQLPSFEGAVDEEEGEAEPPMPFDAPDSDEGDVINDEGALSTTDSARPDLENHAPPHPLDRGIRTAEDAINQPSRSRLQRKRQGADTTRSAELKALKEKSEITEGGQGMTTRSKRKAEEQQQSTDNPKKAKQGGSALRNKARGANADSTESASKETNHAEASSDPLSSLNSNECGAHVPQPTHSDDRVEDGDLAGFLLNLLAPGQDSVPNRSGSPTAMNRSHLSVRPPPAATNSGPVENGPVADSFSQQQSPDEGDLPLDEELERRQLWHRLNGKVDKLFDDIKKHYQPQTEEEETKRCVALFVEALRNLLHGARTSEHPGDQPMGNIPAETIANEAGAVSNSDMPEDTEAGEESEPGENIVVSHPRARPRR